MTTLMPQLMINTAQKYCQCSYILGLTVYTT